MLNIASMVIQLIKRYIHHIAALALLMGLGYIAFFHHLGYQHMNLWDESSYGLNALEMVERGNPVELYLMGEPDLYNTKPPFAIWCMSGAVKLFGFTEKGVRFASAFFGLLAAIMLWCTAYRVTAKPCLSLFMPLVLLSCNGFIGEHTARTGDTDVILAFWVADYVLCFWQYTQASDTRRKQIWLLLFFISFSFACLTKGIGGLTAIPGVIVWAFMKKEVKPLLGNKWFYIGLSVFLILVPGYYFLRNYLTPGYLDTVIHFEFLGRIERQEFLNPEPRGFWFYYDQFFNNNRLISWCWILGPAAVYTVFVPKSKLKNMNVFLLIILASISVMLGISSTKLFWYDASFYPVIAGIIGGSFMMIAEQLKPGLKWIPVIVFAGLFVWPFFVIAQRNHQPAQLQHAREAIRAVRNDLKYTDTLFIVSSDINFSLLFYLKQDSLRNGNIGRIIPLNDEHLQNGACFMTCKYAREADMNNRFILDTLYRQFDCGFFRIRAKKESNP